MRRIAGVSGRLCPCCLWARRGRRFEPEHLAFVAIVVLAAALRLACLDLIEFKGDEAAHLLRAAEVAEQHQLPLAGSRASVGIPKPPMMTLLMAVPLLLGRDPRLAAGFIALLNVAAVAGTCLLARRYYGWRVATVAGLLFAANPWAVVYSRKVFTADVLAPFLVLCLFALHAAIIDRAAWGWLLAVLGLGVLLNITFSPLPLVVVLAILVAIYRRRVAWRALLAGAALAGLLFVPYLYGQARQLAEIRASLRTMTQAEGTSMLGARVLQYAATLHSGRDLGALAGVSFPAYAPAHSPLRYLDEAAALGFLVSLVVVAALALRGRKPAGARQPAGYTILALWLLLCLGIVSVQSLRQEQHYLVILYPAGFIAMAVSVDWAWAWLGGASKPAVAWRSLARAGLGAGLLALTLWQAYSVIYLYGFVPEHDTEGGYGVPLRPWLRMAAATAREAAAMGVDEVRVITEGTGVGYEGAPTILHYLLGPKVQAIFLGQGGNEALLLPAGRDALYLVTRPVPPALEAMLERLGSMEKASLPNPDGRTASRVLALPLHSQGDLLALAGERAWQRLDAGLELVGYDWPGGAQPGETVSLATYWSFTEVPPAERDVQHSLFNHLLNADGEKVAQRDGFGLPEAYWRGGLILVQWFELALPPELPAGDYTLLTGMYRLDDFSRNRVLGPEGQDAGDSIRLGPLRLGE